MQGGIVVKVSDSYMGILSSIPAVYIFQLIFYGKSPEFYGESPEFSHKGNGKRCNGIFPFP